MNAARLLIIALTALSFFLTTITSTALAEDDFEPNVPTLNPEELEPGMTGYGLSVFQGTEPEKFDIEVRGVVFDYNGGDDMIIIMAKHPIIDGHGVIAGMSGSPIFVEKGGEAHLIGALAYGWSFSIRGIAGVAPIRKMLDVYQLVTEESQVLPDNLSTLSAWPEGQEALGRLSQPPSGPIEIPRAEFARMGLDPGAGTGGDTFAMEPLGAPLLVSTRSQLAMNAIEKAFKGTYLRPKMVGLQGGASGAGSNVEAASLQNGSAFSMVLVDGDLQMMAMGTATYVDGNRMVGFGHPMFAIGALDMPMSLSEVVAVIPTLAIPFKIGNTVKEIGAMRQDRWFAVGGTLDARSETVPLSIHLKSKETAVDEQFSFRLWNNNEFLPMEVLSCYFHVMEGRARVEGPMTLESSYTIKLEDGRTLERTDYLSGRNMVAVITVYDIADVVNALVNNRYEPVRVKSIDIDLEMRPETNFNVLTRVTKGKTRLKPGETARATLRLERWRDEPIEMEVSMPIPENLKPGKYEWHLADSPERLSLEYAFRPRLQKVENFDDFISMWRPAYRTDRLYMLLVDPSENMVVDGSKLVNLPKSVAGLTEATIRESSQKGSSKARLIKEEQLQMDAMFLGTNVIELEIVDE